MDYSAVATLDATNLESLISPSQRLGLCVRQFSKKKKTEHCQSNLRLSHLLFLRPFKKKIILILCESLC